MIRAKAFVTYSPFFGLNAGSMWSLPGQNGFFLRWNGSGKVVKITGLTTATALYFKIGKVTGSGTPDDGASCTTTTSTGANNNPALTVSGSPSSSFSPGVSQYVDLRLTNSYATTVTEYARSIVVTLSSNVPACSANVNFTVDQSLTATVNVPGNVSRTLDQLGIPMTKWPKVTMIDTGTNQDACRGAAITLQYSWRYAG